MYTRCRWTVPYRFWLGDSKCAAQMRALRILIVITEPNLLIFPVRSFSKKIMIIIASIFLN